MTIRNRFIVLGISVVVAGTVSAAFAAAAKKQSAIQNGTTVHAKIDVGNVNLFDKDCYDAYYACMDQFCVTDNASGGSCGCSDDNAKHEKALNEIRDILAEAERISTIEVEKIQAGANADIIFTGAREYDEKGNVKKVNDLLNPTDKATKRKAMLSMWDKSIYDDDDFDEDDLTNKVGAALFRGADELCVQQMASSCSKDMSFLRNLYSRQIIADCKAFENSIATKKNEAEIALAQANADVRNALKESFESANKYDLGQCMVEFKKCMQTDVACGTDWINCVSVVAAENAQQKTASTANTKVTRVENVFDITDSTMKILDSKRTICEHVLNECVAVRDQVWPAFLREAAPTIKVAEASAESKFRQSCLSTISDCLVNACKLEIEDKGVASRDACLSRPDMARSFCKVEIDPCERMEPLIWGYVVDKLAAMRVDACTQEVKDCFTADIRCGSNFQNCIGMDYDYIHDICPLEELVVCKKNNPKFSMSDLDSMLMGLYLNIDNAFLDQCQEIVDNKMAEICGSTSDCNRFAADDTIGTGSLRSQKDGTTYRVTGMISFGSIKVGDMTGKTTDLVDGKEVKIGPGKIGVGSYMSEVRTRNSTVPNADSIITNIEEELDNIAGTINRVIDLIESDPRVQHCVTGRDLSQITGKNEKTAGRFPNLLNQVKMQIAVAALRQAQDNYNKKLADEISNATKNASVDLAQYMCQKIAQGYSQGYTGANVDTPLMPPYAISYDVGAGISTTDLTKGGASGQLFTSGKDNGSTTSTETTATFNRDSRICHVCRTIISQDCTVKGGNWFRKKNTSCESKTNGPNCEDIQM